MTGLVVGPAVYHPSIHGASLVEQAPETPTVLGKKVVLTAMRPPRHSRSTREKQPEAHRQSDQPAAVAVGRVARNHFFNASQPSSSRGLLVVVNGHHFSIPTRVDLEAWKKEWPEDLRSNAALMEGASARCLTRFKALSKQWKGAVSESERVQVDLRNLKILTEKYSRRQTLHQFAMDLQIARIKNLRSKYEFDLEAWALHRGIERLKSKFAYRSCLPLGSCQNVELIPMPREIIEWERSVNQLKKNTFFLEKVAIDLSACFISREMEVDLLGWRFEEVFKTEKDLQRSLKNITEKWVKGNEEREETLRQLREEIVLLDTPN